VTDLNRRDALKVFGAAPLAGLVDWNKPALDRAARFVEKLEGTAAYTPKFFTAHEWATVRVLADIVIPKDDHSGSATDAKAPEFMDFLLNEKDTSENSKIQMRGGLAWLDLEMEKRFGKDFLHASDAQRKAVLDDIAFGKKTKPEHARGRAFFDRFRSSVASAFYSSAMGWKDVNYMGNVFNPNWSGCPKPALDKLGVSYEDFDASLSRSRSGK
jgi:gluconate 2-dehydrogenase gamma chain